MKILAFLKKTTSRTTNSSDFSAFFREAKSGEKKEVFMEVARKASEDQRRVIETAHKITPTVA
ncbi:MAG: hypothetical protein WDZ88_00510 [Candidatus Paceibacterota bacterium]